MFASRIVHAMKEPLHNCIHAAYMRHICKIRKKELHLSSGILNCDHVKQVPQTLNIENIFDKQSENVMEESNKINRINENKYTVSEEYLLHNADRNEQVYLNNIRTYYKHVSQHIQDNPFNISFTKQPTVEYPNKDSAWVCKISIKWPAKKSFVGTDTTAHSAANAAARKCLRWLIQERRIFRNNPIVHSEAEVNQILLKPISVNIDKSMVPEIEKLVDKFDNEVKEIIAFEMHNTSNVSKSEKLDIISDIFQVNRKTVTKAPLRNFRPNITAIQAEHINNDLLLSLCNRYSEGLDLPIFKYRDEILNALDDGQVLLIKGHTGCGKSTQVPQFIMDSFIERLQGTSCHMIISQPRKIAAISLAQRVAAERMVVLGDTVAYKVRLDEVQLKRQYGMQFCTVGILLKYLTKNPDLIGISHVIVDEVHEREADLDMILCLLKRALTRNPSVKIVLMSASMNTDLFQNYFNCPVIDVPGVLYPVQMNFLNNISKISAKFEEHIKRRNDLFQAQIMADLIRWIDKNQPPGAILCFLPGWVEMCAVQELLKEELATDHYCLLQLHSMLPHSIQCKVFNQCPPNVRKIILSTDIAETSITIKDVVYVVDSAIAKVRYMTDDTHMYGMRAEPISKSSILQRKGRAGRVQSGVSYHLITEKEYNLLHENSTPDILRTPLEDKVLQSKQFTDLLAVDFFKELPQPPDEQSVKQAIQNLVQIGAIDENELLTPLGTRLLNISISPMLGKALIYSTIFECMHPMLWLITSYNLEEMFEYYLVDKKWIRQEKLKLHSFSDHFAVCKIIQTYMEYFQASQVDDAEDYCYSVRVNANRMEELCMVARLHMTELKFAQMIEQEDDYKDTYASCNELVCGLLLAATGQLSVHVPAFDKTQQPVGLRTTDGKKATVSAVSISYKKDTLPSPYVVSINYMFSPHRQRIVIRDMSVITPLTVLFFSNGDIEESKLEAHKPLIDSGMVVLRNSKSEVINLCMEPRVAQLLLRMRVAIQQVLQYYVHAQGHELIAINPQITEFKSDLLKLLCKLLDKASADLETQADK